MAKVWDDFLPLLSPLLPGCPKETMRRYLAEAAADFFARTYLWRDTIDAVYLAPNQIEYDLDSDAVVEDVISVTYKGQLLERTDLRLLPTERLGETGDPVAFWVQADSTIRVFPTPEARGTLTVQAVLKPSRSGTGVDNWIFETWAQVLVDGAVAKIAAIPGMDWSDNGLAAARQMSYERAVVNARVRDFRGVRLAVRQRPAA